ncbi:DsbA family protein [Brevibacterium spongiae]|uniref:DsbA family protein n=2 Tax=Brevibacterium spongiae TaxID=2909672 RepID=A0ABY5SZ21_9MICO|nr:thioredoxin domain-containing protein [Brevibacterium spongiae]UVI37954.1 DsbA family protein [Brevibacterium spongiae]
MIGVAALVLVVLLAFNGRSDETPEQAVPSESESADLLVRDDSPRLAEGEEAVFVEFLDFECEACLSLYPVIENLREEYDGRVTFVVRYMPLHGNSLNAALAAEAAAEQGEFEAMYQRLFDTAEEWGHQESSQRNVFFGYAKELGLDMDAFTAAYDDPTTLERIEQSRKDGQALGITGTPTFFLDGERLQPQSVSDLEEAFDDALQG